MGYGRGKGRPYPHKTPPPASLGGWAGGGVFYGASALAMGTALGFLMVGAGMVMAVCVWAMGFAMRFASAASLVLGGDVVKDFLLRRGERGVEGAGGIVALLLCGTALCGAV